MTLFASIYMLIVMPFALFFSASFLPTEWSVALLILGAMPTGTTIALMAENFLEVKHRLALVITTIHLITCAAHYSVCKQGSYWYYGRN
ncbi:MAG: hypothetical protein H6759_04915 [Candidatus Nomurabacteria bacterium]|nr:MAG: hypothetical protein H6759_04915 [Candidatus Nomurabacteria bacterium]